MNRLLRSSWRLLCVEMRSDQNLTGDEDDEAFALRLLRFSFCGLVLSTECNYVPDGYRRL